jgi:PAS domain S-box-containing protein
LIIILFPFYVKFTLSEFNSYASIAYSTFSGTNLICYSMKQKLKQIIFLISIFSVIIISAGVFYYTNEKNNIRKSKYDELKAIADLKEKQIKDWIKDKKAEAITTTQSPFFIEGVERWISVKEDVATKEKLTKRLSLAVIELDHENVFLVSTDGQQYLSAVPSTEDFSEITLSKIRESVQKRVILFTDLYYCKNENKIHYDIVAPIVDRGNKVIAVLVYRIDPQKFLFPLVQNWPTPSLTSEIAILKIESDSVVFLNELRHKNNTALKLKISLNRTEVPSVQAAFGHSGLFEGVDYRGVKVLSNIRTIPENNWIMLSKVDLKEIYSDLSKRAFIIAILCILVITVAGLAFFWIYNKRQRNIYVELYNKEKAIQVEQQKFKITMDSIRDGIITADIHGTIGYMNKYAEELTGWTLVDSIGRQLDEVFPVRTEDSLVNEINLLTEVIDHGSINENPDNSILISKTGKVIPVLYTISPVYNINDSLTGVVLTFLDITKQKLSEQSLRKSEALFSKTFHSSPSGIAISRINDGSFVNVNSAACDLYGFSSEELIGHSSIELGLLDNDTRRDLVEELKKHGRLMSKELVLHTGKGTDRTVLFSWESIDYAGESCAIATIADISDRKQLEIERISKEAAIQANQTKSEFLANMSHEIRTPMNAVLGYTELLSSTVTDKTQKNYIHSIQTSGRSLLTLINDILDLSKIEAGRLELEYEFVNTSNFFSEFERIFTLKVNEKGLSFILEIVSGTPKGICIDESRVRQIVFNLLGNAVKFTKEGSITLNVHTENPQLVKYSKNKSEELIDLVIEVSDTGIGISKELRDSIFDPFTQERGFKQFGGTGLGLAITKRLVALMNGTVNVKSELNKGSTFIIKIPEIAFQREFESVSSETQIDPSDFEFEKSVILIADDIEHNRSYFKDVLKKTNLKIVEAEDGFAAYHLAKEIIPDLIVADIRMPKMDGFQLLASIKEDEALQHIPVLAYSASVLKEQKEKIHNSAFAGLLIKPVSIAELYRALIEILPYKSLKSAESTDINPKEMAGQEATKNLSELIKSLESEYFEKWESFSIIQPIEEIHEFGTDMLNLGTKHSCEPVVKYGNDLIDASDAFNIDAVLKLLAKYKFVIEYLKNSAKT